MGRYVLIPTGDRRGRRMREYENTEAWAKGLTSQRDWYHNMRVEIVDAKFVTTISQSVMGMDEKGENEKERKDETRMMESFIKYPGLAVAALISCGGYGNCCWNSSR